MQDELSELNRQVLTTFGQPVMVFRGASLFSETRGIVSKALLPAGQYEAVFQTVTSITLPASLKLQRGDEIESAGQQWTVDRKLKDDGQLTWWGLHEA